MVCGKRPLVLVGGLRRLWFFVRMMFTSTGRDPVFECAPGRARRVRGWQTCNGVVHARDDDMQRRYCIFFASSEAKRRSS